MHIKTEFPRPIREIENIWIPMSDGVNLAARIWLPEDAESEPRRRSRPRGSWTEIKKAILAEVKRLS